VRVDRVSVDFDRMLKILSGALTLTKVGQEVSKVDAGAEVVVVESETLLEVLHAPLKVFQLLVTHADVVECVRFRRALVRILSLDLD